MTSKLIASALCLVLCPLLAAQQVGQAEDPARGVTSAETLFAYRSSIDLLAELGFDRAQAGPSGSQYGLSIIPFAVPLKLTPVDPAAWANATIGSNLTFRVVNDVVRNASNRSSSVRCLCWRVDRGEGDPGPRGQDSNSPRKSGSRVKEVMVGKYIRLELENSPGGHRFSGIAKNVGVWSVKGPFMVVFLPFEWVAIGIACSIGCRLSAQRIQPSR